MSGSELGDEKLLKVRSRKGRGRLVFLVMGDGHEAELFEIGEVVDNSDECAGCDSAAPQLDTSQCVLKSGEYLKLLRGWGVDQFERSKLAERGKIIASLVRWVTHVVG